MRDGAARTVSATHCWSSGHARASGTVARLRICSFQCQTELRDFRLLEVGCGTGTDLVEFLRLGFAPNISAASSCSTTVRHARAVLPGAVRILVDDAVAMQGSIAPLSQHIVYQSTVFSSIVDDRLQAELASAMCSGMRPGRGVPRECASCLMTKP